MNQRFFRLSIHGMRHRKKEIAGPGIACILAMFFITGVLLFQENMYQWQMAENYLKFGNWFVMERRQRPSETLTESAYLDTPTTAGSYVQVYNKNWDKTTSCLGYLSDEFVKQGNIKVLSGRLPQADNEIACDWNTLTQLGSSAALGSEIKIHYYMNDNKSRINPQREASYELVGILADYTDIWLNGKLIPGAVITKDACGALDAAETPIYSYSLKENVRADDYQALYEDITKHNVGRTYYNESVYNFKPWGPERIYHYIYMLVVVIGIAALTYQVIGYQHNRKLHYKRLQMMGATKVLVWQNRLVENIFILLPSGILGICISLLAGYGIGAALEIDKEISFFNISPAVLLKSTYAVLIGLAMAEFVNLYMTFGRANIWTARQKKGKSAAKQVKVKAGRHCLTAKNLTWQMHVRMAGSSGIGQRIGTRIFALCICFVMIFCIWNTYTAFAVYAKYHITPDIVGFQQNWNADSVVYELPIAVQYSPKQRREYDGYNENTVSYYLAHQIPLIEKEEWVETVQAGNNLSPAYVQGAPENCQDDSLRTIQTTLSVQDAWCKAGNTTLFNGMDIAFKRKVENTRGVEKVTYNSFETTRVWTWDSMDFTEMGMHKLAVPEKMKVGIFCDRYLFATAYIEPTREAYSKLSQYMEPSMVDYEAFCRGEQVLVLLQNRVSGAYDNTITPGTKLSYHYYQLPVTSRDILRQNTDGTPLYPYWQRFRSLMNKRLYTTDSKGKTKYTAFGESRQYYELLYQMNYEACVEPTVAGVVHVTDEVKKELSDFVSDYGYYTAIAAKPMGEQACAQQKKLMEAFLGEPLPEDISCEMTGNQMTVHYNLSASYSATENILSTYCKSNDVIFVSNSDMKEQYRTNALNAVLQYGTTMLAAAVVDILICVVLTKSRIEARSRKLKLLLQMGAGKGRVIRICMLEVLREAMWCIFTLPIQLLVQYSVYRRAMKKN